MGAGARISIFNSGHRSILTRVLDQQCVFQGGEQGSRPSDLDGQTLSPGGETPLVYIEGKGSRDGCGFGHTGLNLLISEDGGRRVAEVAFVVRSGAWTATSDDARVTADVGDGGSSFLTGIRITVKPG